MCHARCNARSRGELVPHRITLYRVALHDLASRGMAWLRLSELSPFAVSVSLIGTVDRYTNFSSRRALLERLFSLAGARMSS